jgi:hypothetical protein
VIITSKGCFAALKSNVKNCNCIKLAIVEILQADLQEMAQPT